MLAFGSGAKLTALLYAKLVPNNSEMLPNQWLDTLKNQYNILSRGITAASSKIPQASKGSGPLAPAGNSGSHSDSGYLETAEVTPEFLQAHLDQMHS